MRKNVIAAKIILVKTAKCYLNYYHCDIGKNPDPAKHFYQFPEHKFNWRTLRRVLNKVHQRKHMYLYPTQKETKIERDRER